MGPPNKPLHPPTHRFLYRLPLDPPRRNARQQSRLFAPEINGCDAAQLPTGFRGC